MHKKERSTDYFLPFGNKDGVAIVEAETVWKNESHSIKLAMADELHKIGLSEDAISRQLNINYQRR